MNHLSHRIALPHNTTFNQMFKRSLVIQIFGHEAKIEKNHIKETRCGFFNVLIFKLIKINPTHLALRKLLNPIKYLEFALMATLTLPLWLLLRTMYRARDYYDDNIDKPTFKTNFCYYFALFLRYIPYPILLFTNELLSFILRTPLAPARLIVRPTIDFIKDKPGQFIFFSLITTSVLLAALSTQAIALSIASFFVVNILLIKTNILISQIIDAYQAFDNEIDCPYSKESQKKTTARITNALHGLNPKHVEVRERQNQDLTYSLALFTGTERIFFAKKTIPQNQSLDAAHLKYYPRSKG